MTDKEKVRLWVFGPFPNLFNPQLSFFDGMMIMSFSAHHDDGLSSSQPAGGMRRIWDKDCHENGPHTTCGARLSNHTFTQDQETNPMIKNSYFHEARLPPI